LNLKVTQALNMEKENSISNGGDNLNEFIAMEPEGLPAGYI
jgi:hypothetical protein